MAVARLRYSRVGPRKVRAVVDLIRGLTVGKAREKLALLHRPSAVPMLTRLLKSAVSNANQEDTHYEPEELIIGVIHVDGGPTTGRFRPRAMGRSAPIHKRTAHVRVELYSHP